MSVPQHLLLFLIAVNVWLDDPKNHVVVESLIVAIKMGPSVVEHLYKNHSQQMGWEEDGDTSARIFFLARKLCDQLRPDCAPTIIAIVEVLNAQGNAAGVAEQARLICEGLRAYRGDYGREILDRFVEVFQTCSGAISGSALSSLPSLPETPASVPADLPASGSSLSTGGGFHLGTKRPHVDPATPVAPGTASAVRTPNTGRVEAGGPSPHLSESPRVFPDRLDSTRENVAHFELPKDVDIFDSDDAFKFWAKHHPMFCSIGKNSSGIHHGFRSYTLFCQHKATLPGFTVKDSRSKCHKCSWCGRMLVCPDTGRVAIYLPVMKPEFFERALTLTSQTCAAVELNDAGEVLRVVWKREQKKAEFITRCGHVHTMDGSGCLGDPGFLVDKATKLMCISRNDRYLNELGVEQLLRKEFPEFSAKIPKALKLAKALKAESEIPLLAVDLKTAVDDYARKKGVNVVDNKLPASDADMMVLICASEKGGSSLLVTRKRLMEKAFRAHTLHVDTTFNVIKNRDDKLFGGAFQDAKQTPFPLGFMMGETEDRANYLDYFKCVKKGFDLVSADLRARGQDGTQRLRRVVFDGVNYGDREIKQIFGEQCERGSCNYHMNAANDKMLKTTLGVSDDVRAVAKLIVFELCRAADAYGLIALWSVYSGVLRAAFPDDPNVARVIDYLAKNWLDPKNKNSFLFFSAAVLRKLVNEPHGPVGCRSNNPVEVSWKLFKQKLNKLLEHQRPRNVAEMLVFCHEVLQSVDVDSFMDKCDVLESPAHIDLRFDAALCRCVILAANAAADTPLPSPTDRFFLLNRETSELVTLTLEEINTVVGELLDDRGDHIKKSPAEFQAVVQRLNGPDLFMLMQTAYIIQFHKDYPPGTKDSYAMADCTCAFHRKRTYCEHVLAIHYLMYREYTRTGGPRPPGAPQGEDSRIRGSEGEYWPKDHVLAERFGIPSAFTLVTDLGHVAPAVDFAPLDLLTPTDLSDSAGNVLLFDLVGKSEKFAAVNRPTKQVSVGKPNKKSAKSNSRNFQAVFLPNRQSKASKREEKKDLARQGLKKFMAAVGHFRKQDFSSDVLLDSFLELIQV